MSETTWRALTLKQPWAWAVTHAGKNVENRTWPVPAKHLERDCRSCQTEEFEDLQDSGYCNRCNESFVEPFRVMIHAGAAWDNTLTEYVPNLPGRDIRSAWVLPNISAITTDEQSAAVSVGVLGARWAGGIPEALSESPQPFSAVVAVATITGQHGNDEPICAGSMEMNCSPWAINQPGMWHWELAEVTVLATPVPAKGRLGLWKPDAEIIEAVEAQLCLSQP